jgi:hypothetical protein
MKYWTGLNNLADQEIIQAGGLEPWQRTVLLEILSLGWVISARRLKILVMVDHKMMEKILISDFDVVGCLIDSIPPCSFWGLLLLFVMPVLKFLALIR